MVDLTPGNRISPGPAYPHMPLRVSLTKVRDNCDRTNPIERRKL
jgi:hypothetical protein